MPWHTTLQMAFEHSCLICVVLVIYGWNWERSEAAAARLARCLLGGAH